MSYTVSKIFLLCFGLAATATQSLSADSAGQLDALPTPAATQQQHPSTPAHAQPTKPHSNAFTGKIVRNRVRMRVHPNVDSPVVRELNQGDLILSRSEDNDFYAIDPPADIKGYVFRTYVLDNTIEGNRVNIRLAPELDAPVVGQLNSGDTVSGTISGADKKWLEIALPSSTRFYIAKEYVEKIGDASLMAARQKRRQQFEGILSAAEIQSQRELEKAFPQIELAQIEVDLNKVITQAQDFPVEAAKAKELQNSIQTAYLRKKVAYMECNAQSPAVATASQATVQTGMAQAPQLVGTTTPDLWMPIEQHYFEKWAVDRPDSSMEEFYSAENEHAVVLKGVIAPYARAIKNKPGDFVLLDPSTRMPLAYLYSTRVNLQKQIGQPAEIHAVVRDNNHFAYPAYFVLSLN